METIKHLYIIGNGFDIHHGIKCSYRDFYNWMSKNNLLNTLGNIDNVLGNSDCEFWCDLENNLGTECTSDYVREIIDSNRASVASDHYERDLNDAQCYVEQELSEVYNAVTRNFEKWINTLNGPNVEKQIEIEHDHSIFLTFNYTLTLEKLYNIPADRVIHIHGRLGDANIIIGHGIDEKEITKWYYGEGGNDVERDLDVEWALDEAISIVSKYKKPVSDCIKKHQTSFFDKLTGIEFIHVYGFSFNKIDIPYLDKIKQSVSKDVQWEVNFFSERDLDNIKNYFVDMKSVKTIKLSDILLATKNQLSLF